MKTVFILERNAMENLFETVEAPAALSALQGVGTNALVHNPFGFETVEAPAALSALQGVGTNALVHNPFAFG